MASLTAKENLIRILKGETPEYVPWGYDCYENSLAAPGIGLDFSAPLPDEFQDVFGVPTVMEFNSGPIPKPGAFILTDITKWRDVIKRPAVLDEIDWELSATRDLANRDPGLIKYFWGTLSNGYFMNLTYFMGFEGALCACVEEPEEVKALMNFLLELNIELCKNFYFHYRPDVMLLGDDIAHEQQPFVSEALFLDIFEPMWRKTCQTFKELGAFAQHHNCGRIEPFIPYIVDEGFDAWDPAQRSNDLRGIKWRYDNKFCIMGGMENNGFISWPETTEEQIRAEVRMVMDELAPGGAFGFGGMVMGAFDNEESNKRSAWIRDEYEKNKYNYYN